MTGVREALKNPKPYLKVMRNAFTADIEYRASYYILIFSSLVTVFMELAIFKQIFAHREQAGDLHRSQALSFIVLGMIIRTGVMLWSTISEYIDQIRDGSFRKFLMQPLHFPSFFLAQALGPKMTTWTMGLVTVIACKFSADYAPLLPLDRIPHFLMAVAAAYFLTWQMYLTIVYLAFWVEEATFLSTAFNIGMGLFTGTLMPLSWFPKWFAGIIELTPFPLIGSFPLLYGIGALDESLYLRNLTMCFLWIFAVILLNSFLQKRAFTRFEAYGG